MRLASTLSSHTLAIGKIAFYEQLDRALPEAYEHASAVMAATPPHIERRNRTGGVRDVVVYAGCVTNLTCDDAIGRGCIANDRLRYAD